MGFELDKSFGDIEIDYHILETCRFNEFTAFVEQYFREKKLTFCLLEFVLLKEQGIGRIYIYGKKDRDLEGVYSQYYDLVTKFKKDFKGGPSSYDEWYSREGAWYVIGRSDKEISGFNRFKYKWHPDKIDPKDLNKYGSNLDELTDSFIENYLNKYEKEFVKIEFKNHPHYAIIIKPLGSLDPDIPQIKPLGNLYLHFGTVEEFDKEFLKTFMKDFLLIWYKNYGGSLIEETKRKLLDDLSKTNSEVNYLPETPYGDDKKNLLIKKYLEKIYTNQNFHKNLEDQLSSIKEKLIPSLLKYRKIIKNKEAWDNLEFLRKFMKGKLGQDFHEKESSLTEDIFIEITVQRHIALVKILLFGFKPIHVHYFLMTNKQEVIKISETSPDNFKKRSNAYTWFYNSLYLSVSKEKTIITSQGEQTDIKSVQETIYLNSSGQEKIFLKKCLKKVKECIADYNAEDAIETALEAFNDKCFSELKLSE